MDLVQLFGWGLVLSAWSVGALLPLQAPSDADAVSVVFAPWISPKDQTDALVAADLFIAERQSPWTVTAFSGDRRAIDAAVIRQRGGVAIVSRQNFQLCAPRLEGTTARGLDERESR